jgi:hypothetical protein
MATPLPVNQLALAPLGAGDLIDRAVRLYRRHFSTLIRIAAPPVVVTATGSVLMTLGSRPSRPEDLNGADILLVVVGFLLWVGGVLLNIIVMGGAARNLITNMLWNEPFSARTTYRNVRARFWSLLGASVVVILWIGMSLFVTFIAYLLAIQIFLLGGYAVVGVRNSWVAVVVVVVWILAVTFLALLLFFALVKYIAYVPQVLMVEGRAVFDSVGRSFTLAKGNLRRLMAMSLFHFVATYSALMILIVPLMWYGHLQGVQILPNKSVTWPMWYAVGYSVITQASAILLAPVWMLGLSLMYVDERVRQEGYDIELMAARQLAPLPNFHGAPSAPYAAAQPAYAAPQAQYNSPGSTLGLR